MLARLGKQVKALGVRCRASATKNAARCVCGGLPVAVHHVSLTGEVDEGDGVAGGGDDFVEEVI